VRRGVAIVLILLAPAALAAQDAGFTGRRDANGLLVAGVPHVTRDVTHGHVFSITVRRVQRVPRASLPVGCPVEDGLEAVIVHIVLANREARPFAGIVEHFVLVWRAANGGEDGVDAEDVTCPVADSAVTALGELTPPIPPGGRRRVRLFFPTPVGAHLLRLDYHDDDFPAVFAVLGR